MFGQEEPQPTIHSKNESASLLAAKTLDAKTLTYRRGL